MAAVRKRTGNIKQRGATSWRIRYVNNDGPRQSETIKGTRDDAERELASRLGDVAKGLPVSSKPNTVLFGELADDVLTDYEVNGYASVDDIETRFRLHIEPVFGKRKASQITTAQIKNYIVMRQKAGAADGTINRELEAIRHTFNLAREGGKLVHAPHVPRLREDNVRTGFLTREEVERLCRHLPAPYDSFTMFGFLTGWRYSEIQKLEWRNVDMERGEIRIDVGKDKNRAGRVFPMSTELRLLLKSLTPAVRRKTTTSMVRTGVTPSSVSTLTPFVFAISGKPVGAFRKTWKAACHKAGLPCIVNTAGKVIKSLRTFHDLRRSFAREMDRQGVRQGAIMRLGGWKTDSVFRRYNIVSDGDLRDAIDKIDAKHSAPQKAAVVRRLTPRAQKQKPPRGEK